MMCIYGPLPWTMPCGYITTLLGMTTASLPWSSSVALASTASTFAAQRCLAAPPTSWIQSSRTATKFPSGVPGPDLANSLASPGTTPHRWDSSETSAPAILPHNIMSSMISNSLPLLGVFSIGRWTNSTLLISKFTSAANGPLTIGSMPLPTGTLPSTAPCPILLPTGTRMNLFHLLRLPRRSSLLLSIPPQPGPHRSLREVHRSVFSPHLPRLRLKGEEDQSNLRVPRHQGQALRVLCHSQPLYHHQLSRPWSLPSLLHQRL